VFPEHLGTLSPSLEELTTAIPTHTCSTPATRRDQESRESMPTAESVAPQAMDSGPSSFFPFVVPGPSPNPGPRTLLFLPVRQHVPSQNAWPSQDSLLEG
jgi:hypothetical protein